MSKPPGDYRSHRLSQLRAFPPHDLQKALREALWFWGLILKGRQHGISTFICLVVLDTCLATPNTHCGLIDATLFDATKRARQNPLCLAPDIKAALPLFRRATGLEPQTTLAVPAQNGSRACILSSLEV